MTVEEMRDRMSSAELTEWMAFDTLRNEDQEKAARMAKKGMRAR